MNGKTARGLRQLSRILSVSKDFNSKELTDKKLYSKYKTDYKNNSKNK